MLLCCYLLFIHFALRVTQIYTASSKTITGLAPNLTLTLISYYSYHYLYPYLHPDSTHTLVSTSAFHYPYIYPFHYLTFTLPLPIHDTHPHLTHLMTLQSPIAPSPEGLQTAHLYQCTAPSRSRPTLCCAARGRVHRHRHRPPSTDPWGTRAGDAEFRGSTGNHPVRIRGVWRGHI
jgi:hypothetical protein